MSWDEFFPRVSVGGAMPAWFEMSDPGLAGEVVRLTMRVPCVHTGAALDISRKLALPAYRDEWQALQWARTEVQQMYLHEVDEQLQLDDTTVFEPVQEH